jgi:hypothetical protein
MPRDAVLAVIAPPRFRSTLRTTTLRCIIGRKHPKPQYPRRGGRGRRTRGRQRPNRGGRRGARRADQPGTGLHHDPTAYIPARRFHHPPGWAIFSGHVHDGRLSGHAHLALAAAAEPRDVGLADALSLVLLIRDDDPQRRSGESGERAQWSGGLAGRPSVRRTERPCGRRRARMRGGRPADTAASLWRPSMVANDRGWLLLAESVCRMVEPVATIQAVRGERRSWLGAGRSEVQILSPRSQKRDVVEPTIRRVVANRVPATAARA